ncbi:MAG: hypothetical protein CMJ13_05940, partial [Pelagibacterales bacterium]|nr:hypothetical protein [Pelagibacterales bacterium]
MKTFTKISLSLVVSAALFLSKLASQEVHDNALPEGGKVASGSATIQKTENNLSVNQSSNKLILNWETFNIGKNASVEFFQPDSSSTALNRVHTSDPSHIYGSLKANGTLIFINPSGVIFQGGSKVDVGAMIASSLNMSDDNFLNENYFFEKDNNYNALIKNKGDMSSFEGGAIALISNRVENNGNISTPGGKTALLSGEKINLSLDGNKLINYSIEEGSLNSLIENNHAIAANDGAVILSSEGKDEVLSAVINNKGTIKANGITKKGGKIFLSSKKGKIKNSGTLIASSEISIGGKVEITADEINIKTGSIINVSGKTGGGRVLVGGSWQNTNPEVYQAKNVVVEENTKIDASSIKYGIGGEIVVWSDIHNKSGKTIVKGTLLAKGGPKGGDGGKIETSGNSLNINNSKVSTKSFTGKDGEWLLDPYNIEITGSGGSDYTANEDDEEISASTLVSALASSNITVRTDGGGSQDGNITVSSAISSSSGNDLTLQSNNDIFINANITRTGSGGLVLTPGSGSVSGSGTISLGGGSSISSASGSTISNSISLASGDATFDQSGTATYSGVLSGSGNFIKSGSGTLTLSGSNTFTGDTTISAGTLTLSGTLSDSTDVIVNSGTTYDVNANDTIQSLTGSGTIDIAASRTLTAGGDDGSENISGNFTGSGNFVKQGSGTYTLQGGSNSISGVFTSSAGELVFKGTFSGSPHLTNNATSTLDNDVTFASVQGSGAFSIPDTLTLTTGDNGNNTISGTLSGNGTLVKQGNGTLTLSGTNSSFTGAININAGTIAVSDSANLGATPGSAETDIVLNGGALRATAAFTLGTNKSISLTNNSTINVDTSDTLTYGGVISGSYGLTKSGAGTLVLTGNNSYTGSATLSAGTLQVASDANISGSPGSTDADNIIFSGGTLNNTSGFTLDSNRGITLSSTGTINTDSSTTLSYGGVVAGAGAITKSGDGTLSLSGANTYTGDTTISA